MRASDLRRVLEDVDDDDVIVIQALGELYGINPKTSGLVGDDRESFLVLNADDEALDDDELFRRCIALEL